MMIGSVFGKTKPGFFGLRKSSKNSCLCYELKNSKKLDTLKSWWEFSRKEGSAWPTLLAREVHDNICI